MTNLFKIKFTTISVDKVHIHSLTGSHSFSFRVRLFEVHGTRGLSSNSLLLHREDIFAFCLIMEMSNRKKSSTFTELPALLWDTAMLWIPGSFHSWLADRERHDVLLRVQQH